MNDDLFPIVFWCAVLVVIGGVILVIFWDPITMNGQRYDVTFTVGSVEKSTRFGDHTNVWAQQYSGSEPLMYILKGHQDLVAGKTYHVIWVNRIWISIGGVRVWGEVELIEEVM